MRIGEPIARRIRAALALATALAVSGCPAGAERESEPQARPADPATEALEKRCIALLREVRRYCPEGLSNDRSANRYRCLDARLALEKECF